MRLLDNAPAQSTESLDAGPLLGAWVSSTPGTRGIRAAEVTLAGDAIELRIRGAGDDGEIDWGTTHGELYPCTEEDRQNSICLFATYDFDCMQSELQLRVNKGVLSLTSFNTFRDASGRNDYVVRELFYRRDDTGGTA
ncbi:MAG: hypothetical protein AAF657_04145 [Acidobacteriota bacterium]